jgi:hypothetical protein
MGWLIGLFAFAVMLAIVASVVLAAIAAVVEILPPVDNPDTDDRSAGTPVTATMHPGYRLAAGSARKPGNRLSH